ncbi:alpha/beta hydrolase [Saccharopolyspora sp. NFXS83]|uniref:alpha/beta hydrolase n=1 Tax=Saccharopolyspora sp. NFXS83 TaxID=2993560 RepID=UPI00224B20E8|nr:alpha/beta hydrolase [Saccharopolyspora sp. NFXS83]MCX2731343.1 alpha/beta hydrolase [Saccharopolyspora sp. NFXS83]
MDLRKSVGRSAATLIAAGLAGSLLAVPSTAEGAAPEPTWGPCPADVAAGAYPLQCTTVPVPVNYADPDGPQIDLMISRLASDRPDRRRGVMLLNQGGPGGSGLSFSVDLANQGLPASVMEGYDLIGMDTRGVGHSAPVSCGFTDEQAKYGNIPPYAVDDAAVDERAEAARTIADQCAQHDQDGVLRSLTTANMARDLDRVRAALGEEKASLYGASYGTALGAAYASMFPERADRVVLDSNIGDTVLDRDGMRRYALGTEETFPDFAAWVAERHGSYGLGSTPEQVRRTYFELAERLDAHPMADVDGGVFRLVTFGGLFGEPAYGRTAQLWQSLHRSDEAAVRRQLAEATPAEPSVVDNSLSVFLSVTCNDVAWPEDVETYRRGVAEDREKYPVYGAATANVLPCAFWSHEPAEPPVPVLADGPDNVLILQNRRDPVTPHRGAELLREKFGDRARLVSADESGHGTYMNSGNACASAVTTAFLVDGTRPDQDVSCAAS